MRQIVSAAAGLWIGATAAATAQQVNGVVVELYTSQGCSSCPAADAVLAELAQEPGVIPLALHVDYWDYIGWADTFANPRFTDRQKAYAHAAGEKMIYTPQVIVAGRDRLIGHEAAEVRAAIARAQGAGNPVVLELRREGDRLVIRALAEPPLPWGAVVQLVRFIDGAEVDIAHGENAGRRIEYRNIVTSWQPIAEWPGVAPLEMTADLPGGDRAAVIVQRAGFGEILAAAVLD